MNTTRRQMWELNKYLWMSLAGVLIYIPVAYAQGVFEAPLWAVCALFGVAVCEGAARSLLAYRRGGALEERLSAWFNYTEIALITLGIGISGGIHSDLWLLYFVTMTFESLYASRRKNAGSICTCSAFICWRRFRANCCPRMPTRPPSLRACSPRIFSF